jgi:hypothetical protein
MMPAAQVPSATEAAPAATKAQDYDVSDHDNLDTDGDDPLFPANRGAKDDER